jgi:NAD(P)-dependent dehydrogenase (short-subunit alcohol dehydrogenase family)
LTLVANVLDTTPRPGVWSHCEQAKQIEEENHTRRKPSMSALNFKIPDMFDLSGRTAAVTGGGGVLCGTMAQFLGENGVKVAVIDLSREKAREREASIRSAGGEAKAFACDALDEKQLAACYAEILDAFGPPDFLVNGAGGNAPPGTTAEEYLEREPRPGLKAGTETGPSFKLGSFFDLTYDGFRRVSDLNFLGTVLPTKVFSRGMVEKGKGSIVNMSSMSAITPLTKTAAYSAAKAAVTNFTRWLAVHFSHVGVRVNALAPGFFMTEQLRFLYVDQKTGQSTPRGKRVLAHTPMGRFGEPGDLLGALVWLLSDASSFVTGSVIPIDGGFSSYTV